MATSNSLLSIGISLGDPSGIGPEIVAAALSKLPAEELRRIQIFGDASILSDAFRMIDKVPTIPLSVHSCTYLKAEEVRFGQPTPASDAAQVAYLESAMKAAKDGTIAGLATAPICKAAAQRAGFAFPGHTEFLANRLGSESVAMMFAGPKLKVVLATVHEAVTNLAQVLTQERIESAILLAARTLRQDFGILCPRIGVLGLNPHAGEGGRFGNEEKQIIMPAIESCQAILSSQASIEGPLVPDVAFRMPYDCFVAMYHDQGLIPVKLIDFDESVNLTLGLPIVRTSPDHGVAYDIAGQGIARATSMSAAIALAFHLVDKKAGSKP